ncbi:MAG TPA: precorrin-8X methylmutase [Nitrososphaeraceae archaeon]
MSSPGNTRTDAGREMSERAIDIEKLSFEIIEAEIGSHDYNELEWPIVRRVIHATADFDFARKGKIIFHNNPIDSAFDAIKNKCNIVTDVDMVLSALNKKSIADLGLKSACYISDKTLSDKARLYNKTRSEMAMRYAADEINGGIVAIGNAPTALYEIIKMVRENVTKPALIVGIPVGFVSASESKDELRNIDTPFISNVGRKGGSPAASSIVNAIMLLYKSKL